VIKTSATMLQERLISPESSAMYGKKLLQIQDTCTAFHETFCKRVYQLCQFLQMKQQTFENMLKEQKTSEKSFQNMY
jgi:hypothetical protein